MAEGEQESMRNLRKRIEALQQTVMAKQRARQAILARALGMFSTAEVESLISASGADRQGRPLREREAGVRLAYRRAVEDECQRAGIHAPSECECRLDLHQAMVMVIAACMSGDELNLV